MLKRWQHVTGLAAAVTGTVFAATYGGQATVIIAYVLAAVLGVVVYIQGDRYATEGVVTGNVLFGYLAGVLLSLAFATGLLVWLLNAPVDAGGWQVGLMMWDSWAGIGVAILSGFFLTGFTALLH
jgi:hypothetical protein